MACTKALLSLFLLTPCNDPAVGQAEAEARPAPAVAVVEQAGGGGGRGVAQETSHVATRPAPDQPSGPTAESVAEVATGPARCTDSESPYASAARFGTTGSGRGVVDRLDPETGPTTRSASDDWLSVSSECTDR